MIRDELGIERYGCIYGIKAIDPLKTTNGFYIGQTVDFKQRRSQHWRANDKAYLPIEHAINKYTKHTFEMFIIEYCDSLEAMNEAEEFWIAYYKSIGTRLYNIKKGGNNHVMAQSTKNKIGLANKGRVFNLTQEARDAQAASNAKPVISMDQFGIITEFKSIRDASRNLNICVDSIQAVANKTRTSTLGYTFIYKEEEMIIDIKDIIILTKPTEKRKIFSINEIGNKLEFESVKKASEILNLNYSHIFEILYNKPGNQLKTLGGYTFVFEDDTTTIEEILLRFTTDRAKPIIAIDLLSGNEIKFKSVYKASKTLNIPYSIIRSMLNGKVKLKINYTFKFDIK